MLGLFSEFKTFIARGNVIDLAVGVIIGGAFGKIVTSLVNDIVMPPIGLLLKGIDFSSLFFSLNGKHFDTISQAKVAGAPTINYGLFINTLIEFLITAFVIFMLVRQINKLHPKKEEAPNEKSCPYCFSNIPI